MSDKPSYLGLLNAIAVGELGGERLFDAWAAATPNDDVRGVLQTVALREGEHARSFAKRIDELGYTVRPKDDAGLPGRLDIAASPAMSDCEKFERLGFSRPPQKGDAFAKFFDDVTIDVPTGELLGRYLSEERDTGRLLHGCYSQLAAAAPSATPATTAIDARLERIECALAELSSAVVQGAAATEEKSQKKKKKSKKK